jgi:hypothetical protein
MAITSYLEALPLSAITKYHEGPPKDAVPFIGHIRKHPSEKKKLVLIYDPLGSNTRVMEFKMEDILHAEEVHSAVTETGEGIPLVKLWIRKGAHGVILEPFEVQEPIRFGKKFQDPVKVPGRFLPEA